jgi:hypothetical protein
VPSTERETKKAETRDAQPQQQHPVQAPVINHPRQTVIYQSAPTITAMQVRREKEAELSANDQYWGERLKKQEDEFLKNNKILEKEFNDTVCTVPIHWMFSIDFFLMLFFLDC